MTGSSRVVPRTSLASGAHDLTLPVLWATTTDSGGRFGGTAAGFVNFASSLSGMLAPLTAATFARARISAMLKDLVQSKNGVPALVVLGVGLGIAVLGPPLFMPMLPGWMAGLIGLVTGSISAMMAVRGVGASDDESYELEIDAPGGKRSLTARPYNAGHQLYLTDPFTIGGAR